MLTCKKAKNQIDAYLDGLLSSQEKAMFEEHLKACPSCRDEVEWALAIKRELNSLEEIPAPVNLHASIMAAVKEESVREKKPFFMRYKIYSPVVAALVLAFVFRTAALDRILTVTQPTVEPEVPITAQVQDPIEQNPILAEPSAEPDTNHTKTTYAAVNTSVANQQEKTVLTLSNGSEQAANSNAPSASQTPLALNEDPNIELPSESPDVSTPSVIVVGPDDPMPVLDHEATEQVSAYQRYAQNPDDYDKTILNIKKSAVSGIMALKVGNVSFDYFEQIKAKLSAEDYIESFVESETGNSLGNLYMIIVDET